MDADADSVLRMESASAVFGGLRAADQVSLSLSNGEVVGLLGPNGSGKTTVLNLLSGFIPATSGKVSIDGVDITKKGIRERAHLGISRTFQTGRVFDRLSVFENIEVAALGSGLKRQEAREYTRHIIESVGLTEVARLPAKTLTAGVIRMTALARCLANRPRFLLLDEPAAGQNEKEGRALVESIRGFALDWNLGVLLVEHDLSVIIGACDRLHVLDSGKTVIEGDPQTVRKDPKVIEIYFGERVCV